MGLFIGALLVIPLAWGYWEYNKWLKRGFVAHHVVTSLRPDEIRAIFDRTVAVFGWKIVSDGDPRLAQSPIYTGVRQQIGLEMETTANQTEVLISPARWSARNGVFPRKAHTMRIRLKRCARAIEAADERNRPTLVN